MNGPRALALGMLAGWVLATTAIAVGAALGVPLSPWTYPVGCLCSLVIGWGLPAIWFRSWRAVPRSWGTPEAPPGNGGGASGGARGRS